MVGWMELMTYTLMDRQSSRWNHVWVDRQMSHATDIWMDLSCWWYDRQTHLVIHLNHACDATSPQSTVMVAVVHIGKFSGLQLYWDYLDDPPIKLVHLM